jgi:hypothetical protein
MTKINLERTKKQIMIVAIKNRLMDNYHFQPLKPFITLTLVLFLTFGLFGQKTLYNQHHKNKSRLISSLGTDKEILMQGVVHYQSHDKVEFRIDESKKEPEFSETRMTEILFLTSFARFYDAAYVSGHEKFEGPYMFFDESFDFNSTKKATLPVTKSSNETSGVFFQDLDIYRFSIGRSGGSSTRKIGYKTKTNDMKFITPYYFNNTGYMILKGSVDVSFPIWMDVEIIEKNLEGYKITKKQKVAKNIKTVTYSVEELGPLPRENNAPGISHDMPHLIFILKSYKYKRYEGTFFQNTQDMYNWYYSLVKDLEKNEETLKPVVDEIIKDAKTNKEKIAKIFYWIQENIRYIAFEDGLAGFKPDESVNVYNKRYGDCKGMANLAKNMLQIAGFDARLTWLGTRRLNYDYSIPSTIVDNHMICVVYDGNEKYFIDPTEEFIALGDYAHRIQGKQVLIEDGEKYILDTIPVLPASVNLVTKHRTYTVENGELKGKEKRVYNGESRTDILRSYEAVRMQHKDKAVRNFLRSDNPNIDIEIVSMPTFQDREIPLEFEYNFSRKNYVKEIGSTLLIPVDMSFDYYGLELKDRKRDYWMGNKIHNEMYSEFIIPKGYKVVSLPLSHSFESESFKVELLVKQEKGKVLITRKFIFYTGEVPLKEMEAWQKNVPAMRKFYDSQIVLSK